MNFYRKFLLKNIFLICVSFSVLFAIAFYIVGYNVTKNVYTSNARQYIENVANKIDNACSKVQNLKILFTENDVVKEYVESDQPSAYSKILLVQYLRSKIGSTTDIPTTIGISNLNDNGIVLSNATMSLDYFLNSYGIPQEPVHNMSLMLNEGKKPGDYVFISHANGKEYLSIIACDNSSYANPYFIFSTCDMQQLYYKPYFDAILVIFSGNKLFYSGNEAITNNLNLDSLSNEGHFQKISTIAEYSKTTALLGDLKYMLVLQASQYFSLMNQHIIHVILTFIALAALSYFLSKRVSGITYGPINQLLYQIENIIQEPHKNEIEYISSVISMLSKRNKYLSESIDMNQEALKEKFLNDMLYGNLTEEQLKYDLDLYIPNKNDLLPLALIIADTSQDMANISFDNQQDVYSFNMVIHTLFKNEFNDLPFFHFFVVSPCIYCIIISCDNTQLLQKQLKQLLLIAENDLNITIHSTISQPILSWEALSLSFFTALATQKNMNLNASSKMVVLKEDFYTPICFSCEMDGEILSYCLHRQTDKLEKALDIIISENFSCEEDYAKRHSQLSLLLYASCMRIFYTLNIEMQTIFGKNYNIYLELNICENIDEFSKQLKFIFTNIIEYIEHMQTIDESQYCDSMLKFIHENYDKNISLLDLAEHMNMSQSYVSKLFKKLTHYNFKDYLNKICIDKATKLLIENPKKSISSIAALVGFSSTVSFSKAFIKYMGISPSDYRKIQLAQKEQ